MENLEKPRVRQARNPPNDKPDGGPAGSSPRDL